MIIKPWSVVLAASVGLALAPAAFADTVLWSFTDNSAEAFVGGTLSGTTMSDNDHRPDPAKNDAAIGNNGVDKSCSTGECMEDEACLCDQKDGPSPNLDHFLEFTVACDDGGDVDPSELRFKSRMTDGNRPLDIHAFANTDAFTTYAELTDSPQPVTSETFMTFDVDLSELAPAAFWSFRLYPGHPEPGTGQDGRARVDDVEVEGDCIEPSNGADEGRLATGLLHVSAVNRLSKCTYANVSDTETIDVTAYLNDGDGNTLAMDTETLDPGESGKITNTYFTGSAERICVFETTHAPSLRGELEIFEFSGTQLQGRSGAR